MLIIFWYFNKDDAPSDTTKGSSSDPWETPTITCIGSACCYVGSTYDSDKNICLPNAIKKQKHPETTESFRGLAKYGYTQLKPYSVNNKVAPMFAPLTNF